MRKIVSTLFLSLDGVVESPEKWSLAHWNVQIQEAVHSTMSASAGMLLGRVTYQGFAESWSGRTNADDPGADHMNSTRKYVASTTLTSVDWSNSTLLTGDLTTAVAALKAEDGGNLITSGSPTLVRWLLANGLLDELHLLVYPVVVGHGRQLFPEDHHRSFPLELADSTAFDNGVLYLVYRPKDC